MIKHTLIAAGLVLATVTGALADSYKGRIEERQARQLERIEEGRRSGAITWSEGRALRAEQRRISAALKAYADDDNRIDRHEAALLQQMQDNAGQHIRAERNDSWSRFSLLPRIGK